MRRWSKLIWHLKTPSLVTQSVNNMPAMWETQVSSLSWEDPWRRKWQPTPVFLPEKSHGQRSLAGYSPWGHQKSEPTERLTLSLFMWNTFQEECWLLQSFTVLRQEFFWIKTVTWGRMSFLSIFHEQRIELTILRFSSVMNCGNVKYTLGFPQHFIWFQQMLIEHYYVLEDTKKKGHNSLF